MAKRRRRADASKTTATAARDADRGWGVNELGTLTVIRDQASIVDVIFLYHLFPPRFFPKGSFRKIYESSFTLASVSLCKIYELILWPAYSNNTSLYYKR